MFTHDELMRAAAQNSLAVLGCWIDMTGILDAYLGLSPPPKLLGLTVERTGNSTLIRPNVQGWKHLTFKSRD